MPNDETPRIFLGDSFLYQLVHTAAGLGGVVALDSLPLGAGDIDVRDADTAHAVMPGHPKANVPVLFGAGRDAQGIFDRTAPLVDDRVVGHQDHVYFHRRDEVAPNSLDPMLALHGAVAPNGKVHGRALREHLPVRSKLRQRRLYELSHFIIGKTVATVHSVVP